MVMLTLMPAAYIWWYVFESRPSCRPFACASFPAFPSARADDVHAATASNFDFKQIKLDACLHAWVSNTSAYQMQLGQRPGKHISSPFELHMDLIIISVREDVINYSELSILEDTLNLRQREQYLTSVSRSFVGGEIAPMTN